MAINVIPVLEVRGWKLEIRFERLFEEFLFLIFVGVAALGDPQGIEGFSKYILEGSSKNGSPKGAMSLT